MTNADKIASRKDKVVYVDNCSASASPDARAMIAVFHNDFVACVLDGTPLPEDCDLFSMEIVLIDGEPRGILRWA